MRLLSRLEDGQFRGSASALRNPALLCVPAQAIHGLGVRRSIIAHPYFVRRPWAPAQAVHCSAIHLRNTDNFFPFGDKHRNSAKADIGGSGAGWWDPWHQGWRRGAYRDVFTACSETPPVADS